MPLARSLLMQLVAFVLVAMPPIATDEHERYSRIVPRESLSQAHRLYEEYVRDMEDLDEVRRRMNAWQVGFAEETYRFRDADLKDDLTHSSDAWRASEAAMRLELDDRYFTGLLALAPEAEEAIEHFRKVRWRSWMLTDRKMNVLAVISRVGGVAYDLRRVMIDKGLDPDNDPDLAQALASYYQRLDQLVAWVNDRMAHSREPIPIREAARSGDAELFEKAIDRFVDHRVENERTLREILQLHLAAIDTVADSIGDEDGERFREEARARLYPSITDESGPLPAIERARRSAGNAPDAKKQLDALEEEYRAARSRIVESLIQTHLRMTRTEALRVYFEGAAQQAIDHRTASPPTLDGWSNWELLKSEWESQVAELTRRANALSR